MECGEDPRHFIKEWARSFVYPQPIRIHFICYVDFLLLKLKLCAADHQSALPLVGAKVLKLALPCLDSVGEDETYMQEGGDG